MLFGQLAGISLEKHASSIGEYGFPLKRGWNWEGICGPGRVKGDYRLAKNN